MAGTVHLSDDALTLLKLRLSGRRIDVTDETREPYRELAAGLAEAVHTFTKGRDSRYRLTRAAMERQAQSLSVSIPVPSREESAASPH